MAPAALKSHKTGSTSRYYPPLQSTCVETLIASHAAALYHILRDQPVYEPHGPDMRDGHRGRESADGQARFVIKECRRGRGTNVAMVTATAQPMSGRRPVLSDARVRSPPTALAPDIAG